MKSHQARPYVSRQRLVLLWLILPLSTLAVALFGVDTSPELKVERMIQVLILMSSVNLIVLVMFGHLTIQLDAQSLSWHFGSLKWPGWRLPLAQIQRVELCHTHWYEGKGIRLTREGMLYNAAGSGAVRIHKKDGGKFRLGSAEPELLYAKLNTLLTQTQ